MFDTHVHTKFSFDSEMDGSQAVTYASELGIKLTFTEHCDLNANYKGSCIDFERNNYFRDYSSLREKGKALLGIELGLDIIEPFISSNKSLLNEHEYDLVIGSIHNINGQFLDSYISDSKLSKQDFYYEYFNYVEKAISLNPYIDVLAHIDYPSRISNYTDNSIDYDSVSESIDKVMRALVKHKITLEINTKLIDKLECYNSTHRLVQAYKEAGGSFVTIGSDAHTINEIGRNFEDAMKIVNENRLELVYFKNRKPISI